MKYEAWQTECFVILDHFLPFNPLTTEKIKVLKKWKKCFEILIILQMCTINDNRMLYGPWDVEHDGQDFLSLWAIFCPFTTLSPLPPPPPPPPLPPQKKNPQKIKILKKAKKAPGNITILHRCTKNHDHVLHCFWDTMCDECKSGLFINFGLFFPLLPPPNDSKN